MSRRYGDEEMLLSELAVRYDLPPDIVRDLERLEEERQPKSTVIGPLPDGRMGTY